MDEEMNLTEKNERWKLVSQPKDCKLIGTKMSIQNRKRPKQSNFEIQSTTGGKRVCTETRQRLR